MSLFSKLFGGGGQPPKAEPESYEGFKIYPEPARDGGRWRVGARIEKEIAGETRVHQLIRADTLDDIETATKVSANKARQLIDEQGDRLFKA